MSSPAHSSRSVCPLRSLSRSSRRRRLGSARALKASSMEGDAANWLPILRSRLAACQAPFSWSAWIEVDPDGERARPHGARGPQAGLAPAVAATEETDARLGVVVLQDVRGSA